jgi:hypothetical protein
VEAVVIGTGLVFGVRLGARDWTAVCAGAWPVAAVAGAVLLVVGTVLLSRSPVLEASPGHETAPERSMALSQA